MDKKQIFNDFIAELERTHKVLKAAALEAKDAATNEESKAENKYDTRGLEASYLAGAQAKRASELSDNIKNLKSLRITNFSDDSVVQNTALVCVDIEGEVEKWFLITPCEGGVKIKFNEEWIYTLTLKSPLGKKLKNKKVEDYFDFKIKNSTKEYEIIEIL